MKEKSNIMQSEISPPLAAVIGQSNNPAIPGPAGSPMASNIFSKSGSPSVTAQPTNYSNFAASTQDSHQIGQTIKSQTEQELPNVSDSAIDSQAKAAFSHAPHQSVAVGKLETAGAVVETPHASITENKVANASTAFQSQVATSTPLIMHNQVTQSNDRVRQ